MSFLFSIFRLAVYSFLGNLVLIVPSLQQYQSHVSSIIIKTAQEASLNESIDEIRDDLGYSNHIDDFEGNVSLGFSCYPEVASLSVEERYVGSGVKHIARLAFIGRFPHLAEQC